MIQRKPMSILLLFLLLPCKVELFLFPFNELAGLILNVIWGGSAPFPEILQINPMINMTSEEIIRYYGYRYEKHEIITDDGYILELHRIANNIYSKREPIVFVPGLFTDSSGFISVNKTDSAGFFFTNAGYDVWIHNNRGTRYSRKHKTLNPNNQRKYWDFSFHEMGVYDLPATVDYILQTTNKSQVYLAGHSMGGTSISIFLSEKQSYKEKVKEAFLWSPAVYVPRSLFHLAAFGIAQIGNILLYIFGEMEVLPYNDNTMLLISHACSGPFFSIMCQIVALSITFSFPFAFADYRKKGHLVYLFTRALGGSSVKTIRHYIQMVLHSDFSQYDYGPKGNMIAYNQTTAPPYVLQNIKQPTTIYYCDYDSLVNSKDVLEVSPNFTNLKSLIRIPEITFSHFDFIYSPNAKKYIYEPMLAAMSLPENQLEETTIKGTITSTNEQSIINPTTRTPIATLATSIPKTHFNYSDYLYNVLPMMILFFVILLLFMKFIQQQLSERKTKRKETKECLDF